MNVRVPGYKSLSLILFTLILVTTIIPAADTPPADVLKAARDGLCRLVTADASGDITHRALSSAAADNNLSQGFQIYTLSPGQLLQKKGLEGMLTALNMWRFIIFRNNQPASLLTVAPVNGQWQAVSLGGAKLATETAAVMTQWPQSQGYTYRFVRVYQAQADFMQISRAGKTIGIVPLTASRMAFGISGKFDPAAMLSDSEVETKLREIVTQRINLLQQGK